jgi:hypothetical protein
MRTAIADGELHQHFAVHQITKSKELSTPMVSATSLLAFPILRTYRIISQAQALILTVSLCF